MIVSGLILQGIDENGNVETTLEKGIDSVLVQIVIEYRDLYIWVQLLDFLFAESVDRFLRRIDHVLFVDEELACQIIEVWRSF